MQADQSVVDRNTFEYVDNGGDMQNREGLYVPEDETGDAESEEKISG